MPERVMEYREIAAIHQDTPEFSSLDGSGHIGQCLE